MLRKIAMVAVVLVLMSYASMADGIRWFADANYLNYASGSGNPLVGSLADSSVGCFVQLLWVGANGSIDFAYADGDDGTGTTDDLVVSTIWVGYGVGENGYFSGVNIAEGGDIVEGRVYFGRAWNAPSGNYAGGDVPAGAAVRYINSSTWTYPSTAPTFDNFDIVGSGDLNTTLTPLAIPEPGVLALVALGLIGLRLTRKQR